MSSLGWAQRSLVNVVTSCILAAAQSVVLGCWSEEAPCDGARAVVLAVVVAADVFFLSWCSGESVAMGLSRWC